MKKGEEKRRAGKMRKYQKERETKLTVGKKMAGGMNFGCSKKKFLVTAR